MGQEELDTLIDSEEEALETLETTDELDELSPELTELEDSIEESLEQETKSEEAVEEELKLEDEELALEEEVEPDEELAVEDELSSEMDEQEDLETENASEEEVEEDEEVISPPPSTDEHKVVSQLDDVTRDSEIKAGEIFDKLEVINNFVGDSEEISTSLSGTLKKNIELFEKLCEKFPNVESFKSALENNQNALSKTEEIVQKSQDSADEVMMIMDIMQYQDIHRQKIERVINVMRTLSKYMSSLFASDVRDDTRASVANHIDGDEAETVSADDIEALLASFGKK